MDKKTLKIQDLADANQGFLLLDESSYVIWISHKLRSDLVLAGIESRALLGFHFSYFRERVACQKISSPKDPKKPRENFSIIELCGQRLFLTEFNLGKNI